MHATLRMKSKQLQHATVSLELKQSEALYVSNDSNACETSGRK
jgi:hypothetical protein